MGLSRWLDQHAREALPRHAFLANAEKLRLLGPCVQCRASIATHGYELMLQTRSGDGRADYHCAVLCEACYHRLAEKSFAIKSIEEIGLVSTVVGALLVVLGFALAWKPLTGTIGAVALVLGPMLWLPARRIRVGMLERTIDRFFPQVADAHSAAIRMPWLEKSIRFAVPMPLAFVVRADLPLEDIALADLRRVLRGRVANWKDVGGPDLPIRLCLPIGPWREWWLICQSLLDGAAPASIQLADPLELFDHLARETGAAGFVSLALLQYHGRNARALAIDGQGCRPENAAYPLWLMPGLRPEEY